MPGLGTGIAAITREWQRGGVGSCNWVLRQDQILAN